MESNPRPADKAVRMVISAAIITLFITDIITGVTGAIALVLSAILLLTVFSDYCPLYDLIRIFEPKNKAIGHK